MSDEPNDHSAVVWTSASAGEEHITGFVIWDAAPRRCWLRRVLHRLWWWSR